MTYSRLALLLVTFAFIAEAASSESVDADACSDNKPRDVAALLQGVVAVQRLTDASPTDQQLPVSQSSVKEETKKENEDEGDEDEDDEEGNEGVTRGRNGKADSLSCVDKSSRRRSGASCLELSGQGKKKPWQKFNFCKSKEAVHFGEAKVTIGADEATRTCCETCSKSKIPMRVVFGGAGHSTDEYGQLVRPEEAKYQQCRGTVCEECPDTRNCWHGRVEGASGYMEVKIKAGSTFTKYRVEVKTTCPVGAEGEWSLRLMDDPEPKNGYMKVHNNGVFKMEMTEKNTRSWKKGMTWKPKMTQGGDMVQIDWFPLNPALSSKALIRFFADKVDPTFEHCVDSKNCLGILADDSAAGFAIRNMNKNQLECLGGGPVHADLKEKCEKWMKCLRDGPSLVEAAPATSTHKLVTTNPETTLTEEGDNATAQLEATSGRSARRRKKKSAPVEKVEIISFLKAFLGAAGVKKDHSAADQLSLVDGIPHVHESNTCLDPAVEDPESWECNCMETLIKACGGIDEKCFNRHMCGRKDLCDHWSRANCEGVTTTSKPSMIARSTRVSTKHHEEDTLGSDLDATTMGKCASQR